MALYTKDLTIQNGDAFLGMATLGPFSGGTPGLLYTFNEMAGTSIRERMGTGNIGTMTNFPGTSWQPIALPGPINW
jgi:hypothetical protein